MSAERLCIHCGKPLTRREGESADNWRTRQTCSKQCANFRRSAANRPARVLPNDLYEWLV